MCGEAGGFYCVDPLAEFSSNVAWCQYGRIKPMRECYSTKMLVAKSLRECMLDEMSHGNKETGSVSCGNQTRSCTQANVDAKDGCHLNPHVCTSRSPGFGCREHRDTASVLDVQSVNIEC